MPQSRALPLPGANYLGPKPAGVKHRGSTIRYDVHSSKWHGIGGHTENYWFISSGVKPKSSPFGINLYLLAKPVPRRRSTPSCPSSRAQQRRANILHTKSSKRTGRQVRVHTTSSRECMLPCSEIADSTLMKTEFMPV